MTAPPNDDPDAAWRRFVIDHGHGADTADLAFILGQPDAAIRSLRATSACSRSGKTSGFADLYQRWHGREPAEEDWPPPRRAGGGGYQWQAPELALLASLVGRLGKLEIAQALTERLRRLTGDPGAERNIGAVQNAITRIGMQSKDVVGGITTTEAGREIASLAMVQQAIQRGELRAFRVGRRWVIPHAAWTAWKAGRVFPPKGFVPLASLKQTLAIRSDKLSEYARLGYVPSALRCNPYGTGLHSTQFGTWYVDPAVAERLVADRHAGRPMPWHGKPLTENLRTTYRLWQQRQHPPTCPICAEIWGREGAPASFEGYTRRYPPLAHGAKRHLTLQLSKGLGLADAATKAGCSASRVRRALANGTLLAAPGLGTTITEAEVLRWTERGRPTGETNRTWVSLATAEKRYLFTPAQLREFVAAGTLVTKTGTAGAMRGIVYVPAWQCAKLRERIGFSEQEAARRAGVTVPQLRILLAGVHWRGTGAIPLVTVQAVIKRLNAAPGYTVEEAAKAVRRSAAWIEARIQDGTVRPLRRPWDPNRLYLSAPMLKRLRGGSAKSQPRPIDPANWVRVGEAALIAGVTATTIMHWGEKGEIERTRDANVWRYRRESVRTRARQYWRATRFHRADPPDWLRANPG